jgi:hypothetical protein
MLKHNKKKNGRIVYEQLMTLATRLAMSKNVKQAKFIMDIVKDHYAPNTELGKEKKLFDSILNLKFKTSQEAEAVLSECLKEAKVLKQASLEREKINLVNRIIKELGKDFFSIPLKNYKLLASAQILFNEMRSGYKHTRPVERVKIKNVIVENMKFVQEDEEDYEMDNFTFNLFVKKFNEKYSPLMNMNQKQIFTEWMNYLMTEDSELFLEFLNTKRKEIRSKVDVALAKDNSLINESRQLLEEASVSMRQPIKEVSEESVYEIMRMFDVVDDLEEVCHE